MKSCRLFGQYVCLCELGKKGENCEEKGTLFLFFSSHGDFIGHSRCHFYKHMFGKVKTAN